MVAVTIKKVKVAEKSVGIDGCVVGESTPKDTQEAADSNATKPNLLDYIGFVDKEENPAPVAQLIEPRAQRENREVVSERLTGGIPPHIEAWNDMAPSIESAFAKWPSKLTSYRIFKNWLEGNK